MGLLYIYKCCWDHILNPVVAKKNLKSIYFGPLSHTILTIINLSPDWNFIKCLFSMFYIIHCNHGD